MLKPYFRKSITPTRVGGGGWRWVRPGVKTNYMSLRIMWTGDRQRQTHCERDVVVLCLGAAAF